jgi:hypothetical protein
MMDRFEFARWPNSIAEAPSRLSIQIFLLTAFEAARPALAVLYEFDARPSPNGGQHYPTAPTHRGENIAAQKIKL